MNFIDELENTLKSMKCNINRLEEDLQSTKSEVITLESSVDSIRKLFDILIKNIHYKIRKVSMTTTKELNSVKNHKTLQISICEISEKRMNPIENMLPTRRRGQCLTISLTQDFCAKFG